MGFTLSVPPKTRSAFSLSATAACPVRPNGSLSCTTCHGDSWLPSDDIVVSSSSASVTYASPTLTPPSSSKSLPSAVSVWPNRPVVGAASQRLHCQQDVSIIYTT